MGKSVQIDKHLFIDLYAYFCSSEWRGDEELEKSIRKGIEKKFDKLIAHELFTKYKRTPTGSEREIARQIYLDHMGITGRSEIECGLPEPPDDIEV